MDGKKISMVLGGIGVLIGLLALLTPYYLVPICTHGVETKAGSIIPMRCFYMGRTEFMLSLMVIISSSLLFFVKSEGTRKLTGFYIFLLGAAMMLVPQQWAIGLCMKNTMACHTTYPYLLAEGGALAVLGLVTALWSGKKKDISTV